MAQETPEMIPETKESIYKAAQEIPEALKDFMYKEWTPRILAGVLEGVRELPPEHRDHVLQKMAKACSVMANPAMGVRPGMGFEEYRRHIQALEPPRGPRVVERTTNLVEVEYHPPVVDGQPQCVCPMIMLGMVEPFPELCLCGGLTGASFIETATGEKVAEVETLGGIHSGRQTCRYLVHLKPSIASTPRK